MTKREKLRDRVHWAITLLASVMGSCDRLLISASAEKDKRIVGLSYNGSLPGRPHCDDIGHYMINGHCSRTRHAEKNLRDKENTDPEKLKGSHIRVPGTPCLDCLKELAGGNVASIEYTGYYDNQEFQPTPEMIKEIFGENFKLEHCDIDWVELFQELFDRLSGPGGMFNQLGYRIKLVKEPLEKNNMKIYIAVIGQSGSGKTTTFELFKEIYSSLKISVHRFSNPLDEMIDGVNRILARRGLQDRLEKSRPNQQDISTELRIIFGEELLGDTLQKRAEKDLVDVVFLDGVRRPADIEMLRKLSGENSLLLYILAPPEERFERIKKRADRPGDAEKTWEQFQAEQEAEAESLIETLRSMADFELDNSLHDPEYKSLRAQIVKFVNEKLGLNPKEKEEEINVA